MIQLILFFLTSFGAHADECHGVDFSTARPQTVTEAGCFHSSATKSDVHYTVTFPGGYSGTECDFPYAIFLHGRGGDEKQFSDVSGPEALDQFVRTGGRPFLVIAPTEPRHSYWKNGPRGEFGTLDMVAVDLVAHLEGNLPSWHPTGTRRALVGLSMGGHGALYIAMMRPDLFSEVYAMSPVFRAESDLEPQDRPAYGAGSDFARQDPVSIAASRRKQGKPSLPVARLRMEIGKDDPFLNHGKSNTAQFLKSLQEEYGREAVSLERPGAHETRYWKGAVVRAVSFIGAGFRSQNRNQSQKACLRERK